MVSRTRVTENKRQAKKTGAGSKRKKVNNNKGSTPKFAIHPKNSDEKTETK